MKIKNVLVFPAGTEIGLEIFHALKNCKEVNVFGAGQDVSNHARFIYAQYHVIPAIHEDGWLDALSTLCEKLGIDYIFPAYDDIVLELGLHRNRLQATVVSSPVRTCTITRSKLLTYRELDGHIRVPAVYQRDHIPHFPVLIKPDRGQGSMGVTKVDSDSELQLALARVPDAIICEYLPGEEYTIDCFSDREHGLLFARARRRQRIRNGISVNTVSLDLPEAHSIAQTIGQVIEFHGAWFFQLKRASNGELTLLEVAPRIAGTMATHRAMGVNFPLLSIFECERMPITIMTNPGRVELDRALSNRYHHDIHFEVLYVDLDDTLLLRGQVNLDIVRLIYDCINNSKRVVLITRHRHDLPATLARHRLSGLFDEIIHLTGMQRKSGYITEKNAIFIDDSFAERRDVALACGIPTFDSSMVELLTQHTGMTDARTGSGH